MKKVFALFLLLLMACMLLSGFAFAEDGGALPVGGDILGFAPVMAIVVICYLVAAGLKATALDNKWLPSICGVLGGALGALAMIIMPEFPAGDWLTAVAIGIVSGLAATGINQIGKQLGKPKGE